MSEKKTIRLSDCRVVSVRQCWPLEEKDFSAWLYDHLEDLQGLTDMLLIPQEREANAGRFEADIVAKNAITGERVVIENQFGRSNHDHLGKCLTYQAVLQAKCVIWIGESFTPEHLKTIEYLNKITSDDYHFYAIAVRLFEVGDYWIYEFVDGLMEVSKPYKGDAPERNKRFWSEMQSLLPDKQFVDMYKPWERSYRDNRIGDSSFKLGVSIANNRTSVYVWIRDNDKLAQKLTGNLIKETNESFKLTHTNGTKNAKVHYWQTFKEGLDAKWAAKEVVNLLPFLEKVINKFYD